MKIAADVESPGPNVCVFPTESELSKLAEIFTSHGLTAISIGCGQGFLEGLLQNAGVNVYAVDLEPSIKPQKTLSEQYCYCDIHRIPSWALFDFPRPKSSALLICFGRRIPLTAYLEAFPDCHMCILIGDNGGITDPAADALKGSAEWKVLQETTMRGVMKPIFCVIYQKNNSNFRREVHKSPLVAQDDMLCIDDI
ncbi:hypothetical protein CYMTET_38102 [Cymbomonas tetramitiformis]|uniref:Uncharacterized protein n=1 Tax=Cymbomonas tetramitiformis TaxID=36881 RepID=A0AAE0CEW7_9CHLO|nr:hypothetical protein CYMTET_38102 [Cymbomonas tetramitiformis]